MSRENLTSRPLPSDAKPSLEATPIIYIWRSFTIQMASIASYLARHYWATINMCSWGALNTYVLMLVVPLLEERSLVCYH